jgi:hypothetical protein
MPKDPYQGLTRRQYLTQLAHRYYLAPVTVFTFADLLGPSEGLGGLVKRLEADDKHRVREGARVAARRRSEVMTPAQQASAKRWLASLRSAGPDDPIYQEWIADELDQAAGRVLAAVRCGRWGEG